MLRPNKELGKALWSSKKQDAVLDVMMAQKITTDPSKLPGYKRKEFLKAVTNKIGIGYETRKAFQSVYGEKKIQPQKQAPNGKEKNVSMRITYDEIMEKRKSGELKNIVSRIESKPANYSSSNVSSFRSNTNIRQAEGLIAEADEKVVERLKNIQS